MKKTTLAVILSFGAAGAASAFHPMATEDTCFLGKGARQVEIGFEHAVSREGADAFANARGTELAYGLSDKADLLVGLPWQAWSSGGASDSGLGDLSLEGKFEAARFGGWALALKPGFSLPTGDEERGLGAGRAGFWAYGVAGFTRGAWQYYLNAGYLRNGNSAGEKEDLLKASAAAAFGPADGLLLAAELGAETSADPAAASHPLFSALGAAWTPVPWADLSAGVKLGLNDAADDLGLLLGATLRF